LGLAGEKPMMPAPPKVGPLELEVEEGPVLVDEVPPEADPEVPELSVPDVPGALIEGD
jgi:hypothetical protein